MAKRKVDNFTLNLLAAPFIILIFVFLLFVSVNILITSGVLSPTEVIMDLFLGIIIAMFVVYIYYKQQTI